MSIIIVDNHATSWNDAHTVTHVNWMKFCWFRQHTNVWFFRSMLVIGAWCSGVSDARSASDLCDCKHPNMFRAVILSAWPVAGDPIVFDTSCRNKTRWFVVMSSKTDCFDAHFLMWACRSLGTIYSFEIYLRHANDGQQRCDLSSVRAPSPIIRL